MAALQAPDLHFLNSIFEPTRYHAKRDALRGFYFTSGRRKARDRPGHRRARAQLRRRGGVRARSIGKGRSFFLTDLINRVIIGEAAWVSTDWRAVSRAMIIKCGGLYLPILRSPRPRLRRGGPATATTRILSPRPDSRLEATRPRGALATEKMSPDRARRKSSHCCDLRFLPAGYATRATPVPWTAKFGLSQYDRLQSSSENVYRIALERMSARGWSIAWRSASRRNRTNPVTSTNQGLSDARRPAARTGSSCSRGCGAWADNLSGRGNAAGRKALEEHLVGLLDLGNRRGAAVPLMDR